MSVSVNLANAMQGARSVAAQGDLRAAFALLDRARDTAMAALGPDDPDVLAASGMLARLHHDLGELADARRLLEEGLAAGQRRLGDGHPVMLGLSYELARVADELGNLYEARRRYGLVARLGAEALGPEHQYVRNARRYLGEQVGPSYEAPQAGSAASPASGPGVPGPRSPWGGESAPADPQSPVAWPASGGAVPAGRDQATTAWQAAPPTRARPGSPAGAPPTPAWQPPPTDSPGPRRGDPPTPAWQPPPTDPDGQTTQAWQPPPTGPRPAAGQPVPSGREQPTAWQAAPPGPQPTTGRPPSTREVPGPRSGSAPSPWSATPDDRPGHGRERFDPVSPPAQGPPGRSPWAFAPATAAPPPEDTDEPDDEVLEDYPDRQGAPIYQPPARGGASPWTPPPPPTPPPPVRHAEPEPVENGPVYVAGEQDDYVDDEFDEEPPRATTPNPRERFFPAADPARHRTAPTGGRPAEPPLVTPAPAEPPGYEDDERDFDEDYFDEGSGGFAVVDPPVREVRGVPPKDVRDAPTRQSPWEEAAAAQGGWGTAYPQQRAAETPLPMSSPFGASPSYPTYPARPGTDLVMVPAPARKRSPLLVILLIVAVAVVGGGVAAFVAFTAARPGGGTGPAASASAPVAPGAGSTAGARTAPQALKIRDNGTSVTLTWTDPTTGTVPFIVAGGQQGAMGQLQSLTAGTTTYTINGLNPHLDYCFTVAAVYDTQTVALSQLACTKRASASPKR